MKSYLVEMTGDCREIYYVEANSPEEAAEKWHLGDHGLTEAFGMEVTSVTEEDA